MSPSRMFEFGGLLLLMIGGMWMKYCMQIFSACLVVIEFSFNVNAQIYTTTTSAPVSGWTNAASWTCSGGSCVSYPGQSNTGDVVIIQDNVTLTSNVMTLGSVTINNADLNINGTINFNAASITVNATIAGNASLIINNVGTGSPTVNITGYVSITRNTTSTAPTLFKIGGGTSVTTSTVTIGGDLTYDYNGSGAETSDEISIGNFSNDQCILSIAGKADLNFNYDTPSGTLSLNFYIYNKSSVTVDRLNMTLANGSNTGGSRVRIAPISSSNPAASLTVNGDVTMNYNDATSTNGGNYLMIADWTDAGGNIGNKGTVTINGDLYMTSAAGTAHSGSINSPNNAIDFGYAGTLTLMGNIKFSGPTTSLFAYNKFNFQGSTATFNFYGQIMDKVGSYTMSTTSNNQGIFDFSKSVTGPTLKYLGAGQQNFPMKMGLAGGGGGSIQFYNLEINNTSGLPFTIPSGYDMQIQKKLTLTNGIITTHALNSSRVNFLSGATCPNGGSSSSFVNGHVVKTGNTALIFPTGKISAGTNYWAPIEVTGAGDGTTLLAADYFISTPPIITHDGSCDHVSYVEYWSLATSSGTVPTSIGVTLYWKNANISQIGNVGLVPGQDLYVAGFNGTQWSLINPSTINSFSYDFNNPGPSSDYSGSITVAGQNLNTFNKFTFCEKTAGQGNPLPITLSDFWLEHENKDFVNVHWATQSEVNCDYFVIHRSYDGLHFSPIDSISGSGTSNIFHNYNIIDRFARKGLNYYRLLNVDYDGKRNLYSKTISTYFNRSESAPPMEVFPNPIKNSHANLVLWTEVVEENLALKVFSMIGKDITDQVRFKRVDQNRFDIYTDQLAPGIYTIACPTHAASIKMVVE